MILQELWLECRRGNIRACRLFYQLGYLGPQMMKALEYALKTRLVFLPIPGPVPGIPSNGPLPDPSPEHLIGHLSEQKIFELFLGDPSPQPNIFSKENKLKATIMFRNALSEMVQSLDGEIELLSQKNIQKAVSEKNG